MKCDEVQSLADAYLDSELDVRTTGEIQQHLTACPDCARILADEERDQGRLSAVLRRGHPTPALWERAEQMVREAARAREAAGDLPSRGEPEAPMATARRDQRLWPEEPWWRVWLWPSPRFYACIAAAWMCILLLNFLSADRLEGAGRAASPVSPETVRAFAQQRRELTELLSLSDLPAPEPKSASRPPQTRIVRPDERIPDTTLAPSAPLPYHV